MLLWLLDGGAIPNMLPLVHVNVALSQGVGRGMTVFDQRLPGGTSDTEEAGKKPPNVDVVIDVDGTALKDFFTAHVFSGVAGRGGGTAAPAAKKARW